MHVFISFLKVWAFLLLYLIILLIRRLILTLFDEVKNTVKDASFELISVISEDIFKRESLNKSLFTTISKLNNNNSDLI